MHQLFNRKICLIYGLPHKKSQTTSFYMKKINLTMEDVLKKLASWEINVEDAKNELRILTIERIENASDSVFSLIL